MRFSGLDLAKRLEAAEAAAGRQCVEVFLRRHPEIPAAAAQIAGGVATFAGVDSPITQAIGIGLDGPVFEGELNRLEAFFKSRGAPCAIELCPFVDIALIESLSRRGYRVAEFSNMLARELTSGDRFAPTPANLVVRPARAPESRVWTETVAEGFAEDFPVTEAILNAMEGFFHRPDASCFIAQIGEEVAGGGAVSSHEGVAVLFGASTLPKFRRRGVQSALLGVRLAWAVGRGCDLAMSLAQPGSTSQRNIERFGFSVMYTRAKLIREWE